MWPRFKDLGWNFNTEFLEFENIYNMLKFISYKNVYINTPDCLVLVFVGIVDSLTERGVLHDVISVIPIFS